MTFCLIASKIQSAREGNILIIPLSLSLVKNKINEKEALKMATPTLEELAAEERREYFRQWRAKNKDKVRENNRRYWERKAEKKAQAEQEAG